MSEHTTRDPFVPVVRCAADLLAVVPHTLGYWPADSLVLFAAGRTTAGACVRVDLPRRPVGVRFAATFVEELAELVGHDAVSDRVFAIVYTGLSPGDGPDGGPDGVAEVLALVDEAAARADRTVAARWVVAGDRWWPAEDPAEVHDVAAVLDSAVNAALIATGSSWASGPRQAMDHEYGALPEGTARGVAAAAARWVRAGGGAWHHLERVADTLAAWRAVLERVVAAGDDWQGPLLALDDDLLGFLAAGLAEPVLADLLLADTATAADDGEGVLAAAAMWAELCDETFEGAPGPGGGAGELFGPSLRPLPPDVPPVPPVPPAPPGAGRQRPGGPQAPGPRSAPEPDAVQLVRLTRVLAGEWEHAPDWRRLDALYRVLLGLAWLLEPVPGARRGRGPDGAEQAAAMAGVLVELAQLNRFRARGSHTAHFVRRATSLVPGHAPALRVLRLADARPVPLWARDRSTAWHG
ncbi:DUF4192 family protein [Kocuria dechangensis]|nr:DUF4192 family protein [Kocuria dechangensis]